MARTAKPDQTAAVEKVIADGRLRLGREPTLKELRSWAKTYTEMGKALIAHTDRVQSAELAALEAEQAHDVDEPTPAPQREPPTFTPRSNAPRFAASHAHARPTPTPIKVNMAVPSPEAIATRPLVTIPRRPFEE